MYDVVVIGQGLSGLLSAIWAKENGFHTALIATGSGKIIQSAGVMDLIPGKVGGYKEWLETYELNKLPKAQIIEALTKFKALTKRLQYPYNGNIETPVSIVTGSGHIKNTAFYPETITPITSKGHVVIVGFKEIVDFQPAFIEGNLLKDRPQLTIETLNINLGKKSQRTMTQLDAARLLDQKDIRSHCIEQIKSQLAQQAISQPELFIFPASLGMDHWKATIEHFSKELGGKVTEAPGMPPNATAIRLNEVLKKEATKLGVRFYADTTVVGCTLKNDTIQTLKIKSSNQITTHLSGKQFILATGGVVGGGLEVTNKGLKETALCLEVNEIGALLYCPKNLYPVGASKGTSMTQYGITGGTYSILCSHEAICKLQQATEGGIWSA